MLLNSSTFSNRCERRGERERGGGRLSGLRRIAGLYVRKDYRVTCEGSEGNKGDMSGLRRTKW